MTRKKRLIFSRSILLLCIFSFFSIFASALNADNIHETSKNGGLIKGKILQRQDQKNPNVFPNSDDTAKSLLKQLDKYITEKVTAEKFSGSVLLAKDGKSFFKKAYGFAPIITLTWPGSRNPPILLFADPAKIFNAGGIILCAGMM